MLPQATSKTNAVDTHCHVYGYDKAKQPNGSAMLLLKSNVPYTEQRLQQLLRHNGHVQLHGIMCWAGWSCHMLPTQDDLQHMTQPSSPAHRAMPLLKKLWCAHLER
jgi:hypothetical protein